VSNTKSPDSAGKGNADGDPEEQISDSQGAEGVTDASDDDSQGADEAADVDSAALDTSADEAQSDELSVKPLAKRWLIIGAVALFIIVIDQITKIWAVAELADGKTIDLFWTARFRLIRNFGSAFGLGSGLGRWLSVLIVGIIIGMLAFARTITSKGMTALFGLVIGGAIGNLIDRYFRAEDGFMSGGVIDFVDFQWWPVFNIADMAVVCGAAGLMLMSLREPE